MAGVAGVREVTVETALALACRQAGGLCLKLTGARGVPDRLVVLPRGRVCWVELKRPHGGRLSPAQVVYHERLRRLGHRVEVVATQEQAQALVAMLMRGQKESPTA